MLTVLASLLAVAVVLLAGGSAVRKGTMSAGTHRALLALTVGIVAVVTYLTIRAGTRAP